MLYILCWYVHPVTENQGINTQCPIEAFEELDSSFTPIAFSCSFGL